MSELIKEVKRRAKGCWPRILAAVAGIPLEVLDSRRHFPCPKCKEGTDRFRFTDHEGSGSVICNKCGKTSDGIATVAWFLGIRQGEAAELVGKHLGMEIRGNIAPVDPLAALAAAKRVTRESLEAYGAKVVHNHVEFPAYGPNKKPCTTVKVRPMGSERERKGLFAKGKLAGVFLPHVSGKVRFPTAGGTWYLVEGPKDAAALWSLGLNALGMPTCVLAQKFVRLLAGCDVVVIPDRDEAGVAGAEKSAARLAGIAATVRIALLPSELTASRGDDVRDILSRSEGERQLHEAIESAVVWRPRSEAEGELPQVFVTLDEADVARQVIEALGDGIYQRAGELVHIVAEATPCRNLTMPAGSLRIRQLPTAILRERIASRVRLVKEGPNGDESIRPPQWLISAIHCRGEWPAQHIPPLTGIVRSPTLRHDYTVLQSPGYDPATGLYYLPDGLFPPVPESPSQDDARKALAELLEVVCDFPFRGPDHCSAWLAYTLTLAGRPAIDGPCPIVVFDAHSAGSGKSLLCDVASLIVQGCVAARQAWSVDDAEMRKTITAVAIEGISAVLIDNMDGEVRAAALDAALTGTTWRDRLLGRSETTGTLPIMLDPEIWTTR